ncbi:lytic transglycosylase domain-containing protein [Thermodesulfobacteriota bacterium]
MLRIISVISATVSAVVMLGLASVEVGMAAEVKVPHLATAKGGFRYGFPEEIQKKGLKFAQRRIPIKRRDVRERILRQLNYLLLDRRSRVLLWLSRADSYKTVIGPILKNYRLPPEFIYLAAIESSFNPRALSSAGAYGYWQFIKSTAQCGPAGCAEYDWKMNVAKWKDERADLVHSTHSAARYLAWMCRVKKVRLKGKEERDGFRNWILTAAAYNAGPARVIQRLNDYGSVSYWDVPLPLETEKYVPRWIALSLIGKYRKFYGVEPPARPKIRFETVRRIRLKKDLSVTAIARLLNKTPRQIWTLNTQIPPDKAVFPAKYRGRSMAHTIYVPAGTKRKFLAQLKAHGYVGK